MRRIGEIILNNSALCIIMIIVITLLLLFYLPELKLHEDIETWFDKNDPTLNTYEKFIREFGSDEFVIIGYKVNNPLNKKELLYLSELTKKLKNVPYVDEIINLTTIDDIFGISPQQLLQLGETPFRKILLSDDNKAVGILLRIKRGEKTNGEISKLITTAVKNILTREHKLTDKKFYIAGMTIIESEVDTIIRKDIKKFFPLAIIAAATVLFIIFRQLSYVALPLISAILGLIWILGIKAITNTPVTIVSTTLFALITIIGVATSIHIVTHYQIELTEIKAVREALLRTYQRVSLPCFFTSLTTAIGFGSLYVSPTPAIKALGIFASLGIMIAFILSIIIVPIGLNLIKPKRVIKPKYDIIDKILKWIAQFNLKYYKLLLIGNILIIIIMGIGITRIQIESLFTQYLAKSSHLMTSIRFIDTNLIGNSNLEVIMKCKEKSCFRNPAILSKIDNLQKLVNKNYNVTTSISACDYLKIINSAIHNYDKKYFTLPTTEAEIMNNLFLYDLTGNKELYNYLKKDFTTARVSIRTTGMKEKEQVKLINIIEKYTTSNLGMCDVEITGIGMLFHKSTQNIVITQLHSFLVAIILIILLMILLFGIKGGIISILPNIFPIVIVLGLMGYAKFYLNVATSIIAAVAIGIVVDDTIHYFHHYRYALSSVDNPEAAMQKALQTVGRALIFTTIILIIGFLIFLFSASPVLINFGILSSVAVFTALLGDLFLGSILLIKFNVFKK